MARRRRREPPEARKQLWPRWRALQPPRAPPRDGPLRHAARCLHEGKQQHDFEIYPATEEAQRRGRRSSTTVATAETEANAKRLTGLRKQSAPRLSLVVAAMQRSPAVRTPLRLHQCCDPLVLSDQGGEELPIQLGLVQVCSPPFRFQLGDEPPQKALASFLRGFRYLPSKNVFRMAGGPLKLRVGAQVSVCRRRLLKTRAAQFLSSTMKSD